MMKSSEECKLIEVNSACVYDSVKLTNQMNIANSIYIFQLSFILLIDNYKFAIQL